MVFALPTFFAGVAWRCDMRFVARVVACIACGVIGVGIASMTWSFSTWSIPDVYFPVAAIALAIGNVTLGVLACQHVTRQRRRIFATLGVSYLLGVPFGPLGCLLFTIPSVLIADRTDSSKGG